MQKTEGFERTPQGEKVREAICTLPEPPADPAFRRSLSRQFASGRFVERPHEVAPHRRRSAWEWIALPAAVAALFALAFLNRGPAWEVLQAPQGSAITVDGETVPAAEVAARIARGGAVVTPPDETLTLRHPSGVVLQADAGSALSVPTPPGRWFRRGMNAGVDRGEVRVLTGAPFAGRRLVVDTPEGSTEVTGTVFSVVRTDELTCVCVMRGEARVGRDAAGMDPVPSGMRKVLFRDGRPPLIAPIEPAHAGPLAVFVRDFGRQVP